MNIDLSSLGFWEWVIIFLGSIVFTWMIIGALINRLRYQAITIWLVEGFNAIGKVDRMNKAGSPSWGPSFTVNKIDGQIAKVDVFLRLKSRENIFLWIYKKIEGSRDEITLSGNFRDVHNFEFEVGRRGDNEYARTINSEPQLSYQMTAAANGLLIGWRGQKDEKTYQMIHSFLGDHGQAIKRISLRRREPHLIFRGHISDMQNQGSSAQFFSDFFEIFKSIA